MPPRRSGTQPARASKQAATQAPQSTGMHRTSSAPIARSATDLDQSSRAPALGLDSSTTPPVPAAATDPRPTQPRKKAGGGGQGVARPKRKDADRRDLVRTDSVQDASIRRALQASCDSNERLRYCQRQRETGEYSPTCPLSPPGRTRLGTLRWRSQTCTDQRCDCTLSSDSMMLEHGLGTPSLVTNRKYEATEPRRLVTAGRKAEAAARKERKRAARNAAPPSQDCSTDSEASPPAPKTMRRLAAESSSTSSSDDMNSPSGAVPIFQGSPVQASPAGSSADASAGGMDLAAAVLLGMHCG